VMLSTASSVKAIDICWSLSGIEASQIIVRREE